MAITYLTFESKWRVRIRNDNGGSPGGRLRWRHERAHTAHAPTHGQGSVITCTFNTLLALAI